MILFLKRVSTKNATRRIKDYHPLTAYDETEIYLRGHHVEDGTEKNIIQSVGRVYISDNVMNRRDICRIML